MDEWINGVCDQVDALAARDPYYQELMQQREDLERRCIAILDSLPDDQRRALTDYEYIIMEMAYQRTQIAYTVGKSRR